MTSTPPDLGERTLSDRVDHIEFALVKVNSDLAKEETFSTALEKRVVDVELSASGIPVLVTTTDKHTVD